MKNFKQKGKITKILIVVSGLCCTLWLANVVALSIPVITTIGWIAVWPILGSVTSISWIKMISFLLCILSLTEFFETARDTSKVIPDLLIQHTSSMSQVVNRIDEIKATKGGVV